MILSTLAQVLAVSGNLMVPVALPVSCKMAKAPIINIRPQTREITYDKSKTSAQLSAMTSGTISPYGLSVDQTTGGLRQGKTTIILSVQYNVGINHRTGTFCLSYSKINVGILLQPHIFIAKEFDIGLCGMDIMKHEKQHVLVDRQVIDKYSKVMGKAIQKAVNSAGVIGPFPLSRMKEVQKAMVAHIDSALETTTLLRINEMNLRQQQIDSLEGYSKTNKYCGSAAKKVFRNRKKQKK